MLKVEDIMTKDVISVTKNTPIDVAVDIMRKHNITGMPVIDDDMTLVGVITEKDVLRLFYADEEDKNKTVGFYMTRPAVSYRGDESLRNVCDFMMVNYFRRVPVVSNKGKLIGIISRPDIIDYIIKQRMEDNQVNSKTIIESSAT